MNDLAIFSSDQPVLEWTESNHLKAEFGPKAARLLAIPRPWTPPFAIIAASLFGADGRTGHSLSKLGTEFLERVEELARLSGKLYVRSSIVGETIWDRGTYESVIVEWTCDKFLDHLIDAVEQVLRSAPGKDVGIVLQSYVRPVGRGEFGNLLRVSKTRDHWELSHESSGTITRTRMNTQRDEAADSRSPLKLRPRFARERLFGSAAAWLNTYLLHGKPQRLNCEWIADDNAVYFVQIDEEDEDTTGLNPFQTRIAPVHQPRGGTGRFLAQAQDKALGEWDKLNVLQQLWEEEATHKPTLFYIPLNMLPKHDDARNIEQLEDDFGRLIGPDNIVVRTSVRAGAEKITNLPRTEGLSPDEAAVWCAQTRDRFLREGKNLEDIAFVAHRFIAARASAWVRAEPGSPIVEIHSLWGLPDALQYCPYDIWEVHVPTKTATEYADYKSHILLANDQGGWDYVRIRNEFGRSLSIGRRDAIDIAERTAAISERLGRACHVMWFIGCCDDAGNHFSMPWYWTEAHDAEKNHDRSSYKTYAISSRADLEAFQKFSGSRTRLAVELAPKNQDLMRDMEFIGLVGVAAKQASVPVILAGSTLAHAYFELSRQGCTVVSRGEKDHSRVRRSATFGKIVRDRIPTRIAQRRETEITRRVSDGLKKSFLTSKLLEEGLEVRNAETYDEKKVELADLFEVILALAKNEGVPMDEIISAADEKRAKSGGFDEGIVLLQTGIVGRSRSLTQDVEKQITQLLARKISGSTYELPFTFFGFMELDQPRSIVFEDVGIRLFVTLKSDRIELRASKEAEQLELELDMSVGPEN